MTQHEAIQHWRSGAKEALHWAKNMAQEGSYALALFHCHLAVEKALKAAYMEQHDSAAPFTHSLVHLAKLLKRQWSPSDLDSLETLTPFSQEARYDDMGWVEFRATPDMVQQWIDEADRFLSLLHDNQDT